MYTDASLAQLGYHLELQRFENFNISFCTVTKNDSPSLYEYLVSRNEYFDPKLCWPDTVGEKTVDGNPERIKVCFHNGPHADLPGHLTSQPLAYAQWLSQFHQLLDTPLMLNSIREEDVDNPIPLDKQKSDILYIEVADVDITRGLQPLPSQFVDQMKKLGCRALTTNSLSVDPASNNISLSTSNHYQLTQSGILIIERLPKVTQKTISLHALTATSSNLDAVVLKVSS